MKPQMVAGIMLAAFGAIVMIRGLDFGSQRSVIRVGDVEASVEGRRAVPTWVGGVAILGGVLLIGTSARRRRGA